MKKLLFYTFLLFAPLSFSQSQKKIINSSEFYFNLTTINDTAQTEFITIYTAKEPILFFRISNFDGDCSSENIELGTYKIKDSSLILYTYWASADRMGSNLYPYGFRKKTYLINSKGHIVLKDSKLYIETYTEDFKKHEGLVYLNQLPKTNEEKQDLNDYIEFAEHYYQGQFVFGGDKIKLETEIRTELKEVINKYTKHWAEVYGNNCKK